LARNQKTLATPAVDSPVKNPDGFSVSLPGNELGCRFNQPSNLNAKNVSFKNKVAKLSAQIFYKPLAFPESNTFWFRNLITVPQLCQTNVL